MTDPSARREQAGGEGGAGATGRSAGEPSARATEASLGDDGGRPAGLAAPRTAEPTRPTTRARDRDQVEPAPAARPGLPGRSAPPPDPRPAPDAEVLPSVPATAAQPPTSWSDPRWGMAVELPSPGRKEAGGAVPFAEADPARGAPGPPKPAPDLTPSRGDVPGTGADGGRRPQVSIGTIEVTVVPPNPPAPSAPPHQIAQPPARDRGPATLLAADRLRDGLRRWHGIAQG